VPYQRRLLGVIRSLIRRYRYQTATVLFNLAGKLSIRAKINSVSRDHFEFISKSGLLWNSKLNLPLLESSYKSASQDIVKGNYYQGLAKKTEILHEIYSYANVDFLSHYPPILHNSWHENIGHVVSISYLSHAAKLGIVPPGPRLALVGSEVIDQSNSRKQSHSRRGFVLNAIVSEVNNLPIHSADEWPNALLLSPLVERSEIVKGCTQFFEKTHFMHLVLASHYEKNSLPFIEFKFDYEDFCMQYLKDVLGINIKEIWFCVLHVRESINKNDTKLSNLSNYLPAISSVTAAGGYVFRIGTGVLSELPKEPHLFDFSDRQDNPDLIFLHAYLIKHCRFMITTHSGPRALAFALAKPTLNVNLVGPSQSFFSSPLSLNVPKHYFKGGRELSLREVLSSRFGFAETGKGDYLEDGVTVEENSPHELLEATREMLALLRTSEPVSHNQASVRTLFEDTNAISRGALSSSFSNSQGNWYTD
jgi:putative glycosyltransferase (TIGR04372 family)